LGGLAIRFQFRGALVGPILYGAVVVYGIFLATPYMIDRLVARRLDGFSATLVFPASWAATEYLVPMAAFAGSGTSIAYSQYADLPLLQILSVTGLWGVTFLIGWFAAVCNWVWEDGLGSRHARVGATLCLATIAAVILFGGARLTLLPPSSQTVRVASLSKKGSPWNPSDGIWERAMYGRASKTEVNEIRRRLSTWEHTFERALNQKTTTGEVEEIRGKFSARNAELLSRTEREAQAGALGADIVLDPAGDTPEISPRHTQLASFRAIEQGFNLVRPTDYGLSAAYDYQGRQIAAADYFQASDHVMVSHVPTRGVRTIYSLLGDWFAWACIAALAALAGKALARPVISPIK